MSKSTKRSMIVYHVCSSLFKGLTIICIGISTLQKIVGIDPTFMAGTSIICLMFYAASASDL